MATKSGAGGLVYSVVAIAIIVLIVSTVAVPVIEDSTSEYRTTGQNADMFYKMAANTDVVNITLADDTLTVNGYVLPAITANTDTIVVFADDFRISAFYNDGVQVHISTPNIAGRTTGNIAINSNTVTWTAYDTSDSLSYQYTSSTLLYASSTGDYGAFSYGHTANLNTDSKIYAMVSVVMDGTYISGLLSGTIYNLVPSFLVGASSVSLDFSNAVADSGKDYLIYTNGYNSTISAVIDGQTKTVTQISIPILAPIEYTYISDSDSSIISLLNVVPILLFLVPVMFAVRMIQTRRN